MVIAFVSLLSWLVYANIGGDLITLYKLKGEILGKLCALLMIKLMR